MRPSTHEHPLDVMSAAAAFAASGSQVALAIVTATLGGAVRAPGAVMAISDSGEWAGYLSGGCIDADIRLHAQDALKTGKVQELRYGQGSCFVDIKLPCGGAIDILITPHAGTASILAIADRLNARADVSVGVLSSGQLIVGEPPNAGEVFRVTYQPKLALRIAGRGADCLALAQLAQASDFPVHLQLPDEKDVETATAAGLDHVTLLTTPAALPEAQDDAGTAFVLMFHDTEWETALLRQALGGKAFYIGAVGSRQTQQRRVEALRVAGCSPSAIARIHGPIGLVPSMRDASMLAISAMAEIVEAFHTRELAHV